MNGLEWLFFLGCGGFFLLGIMFGVDMIGGWRKLRSDLLLIRVQGVAMTQAAAEAKRYDQDAEQLLRRYYGIVAEMAADDPVLMGRVAAARAELDETR